MITVSNRKDLIILTTQELDSIRNEAFEAGRSSFEKEKKAFPIKSKVSLKSSEGNTVDFRVNVVPEEKADGEE